MREPTLLHALASWARTRPGQTALWRVDDGKKMTAGELELRSELFAARLRAEGGRGKALVIASCPLEFSVRVLACWKAGFCVIPVDPGAGESDLRGLLRQAGKVSVAVVAGQPAAAVHLPAELRRVDPAFAGDAAPGKQAVAPAADAPALILAGPGMRRLPKLILLRHRHLVLGARIEIRNVVAFRRARGPALHLRPPFTAAFFQLFLACMYSRRTVLFDETLKRVPRLALVERHLREYKPGLVFASTAFVRVLRHGADAGLPPGGERYLFAQDLSRDDCEFVRDRLGAHPLLRYGMTELPHVVAHLVYRTGPVDPELKGLLFRPGKVRAGKRLAFQSPAASNQRVSAGRVVAHGRGGWIASRDRGRAEGRKIFLYGRGAEMLSCAGFHFSPAEIETALLATGLLARCRITVERDQLLGDQLTAVCVAKGGLPPHELERRLREASRVQLAAYKRPRHYSFAKKGRSAK